MTTQGTPKNDNPAYSKQYGAELTNCFPMSHNGIIVGLSGDISDPQPVLITRVFAPDGSPQNLLFPMSIDAMENLNQAIADLILTARGRKIDA